MGRLKGFIWEDPGVPSLTVPYHDTNDFFFSGHVGASAIWMFEYHASGYKFMAFACFLIMWLEGFMLTVYRTHYIIDMITGFIIGHFCYI